jgi:hypothetical protein
MTAKEAGAGAYMRCLKRDVDQLVRDASLWSGVEHSRTAVMP